MHKVKWAALALGLGACAVPQPVVLPQPVAQTSGAWVLSGCTISAKTADVLITTHGRLSPKGALEMRLMFAPQLTRPPYAQVDDLAIPVPIEGSGRHYTLFLPYNPEATGAMLAEDLKIRLAYQRLGETGFQEVGIPSKGLFEALGAMGACGE